MLPEAVGGVLRSNVSLAELQRVMRERRDESGAVAFGKRHGIRFRGNGIDISVSTDPSEVQEACKDGGLFTWLPGVWFT